MAGNPDQQEDNVDEQYQEEGEEEVRKLIQSVGGLRYHSTSPLPFSGDIFYNWKMSPNLFDFMKVWKSLLSTSGHNLSLLVRCNPLVLHATWC